MLGSLLMSRDCWSLRLRGPVPQHRDAPCHHSCRGCTKGMPFEDDVLTAYPTLSSEITERCPGIVLYAFLVWRSGAAQTESPILNLKNIDTESMERNELHRFGGESWQWSES